MIYGLIYYCFIIMLWKEMYFFWNYVFEMVVYVEFLIFFRGGGGVNFVINSIVLV